MRNEKKDIVSIGTVSIGITLYLILGAVACTNEDTSAQSGIGSGQLTVQSSGDDDADLDEQTEKVSDTTADDSACPCGNHSGFLDADGDGVCDHAGQGGCQFHGRRGCQFHGRQGQGFLDANGDGVCDRAEAGGCGCSGAAAVK